MHVLGKQVLSRSLTGILDGSHSVMSWDTPAHVLFESAGDDEGALSLVSVSKSAGEKPSHSHPWHRAGSDSDPHTYWNAYCHLSVSWGERNLSNVHSHTHTQVVTWPETNSCELKIFIDRFSSNLYYLPKIEYFQINSPQQSSVSLLTSW